MITLVKADVPSYLQSGAFYHSLSDDNDDSFTISPEHFRPPGPIAHTDDLEQLLATLRFWGASSATSELLDFVWDMPVSEYEWIFSEYWDELTFLRKIVRLMYANEAVRVNIAVSMDDMDIVKYLLRRGYKFNKASATIAVTNGNMDVLLLIDEQNGTMSGEALRVVQQFGHCAMVDFLLCESTSSLEFRELCCLAVKYGHLNCLQTLLQLRTLETKDLYQSVISVAIELKQLACLMFLAELELFHIVWQDLLWIARGCGDLDALKFVYHKAGGVWNSYPPRLDVSATSSLECVKFAVETGCVLDPTTIYSAAARGNTEIVKYLHEQGYFLDPQYAWIAANGNHTDVVRYIAEQTGTLPYCVCLEAASQGNIECLKVAHEYGTYLPWDSFVCFQAAINGHIDCLKYLHEHDCPWDFLTMQVLIDNKNTEGIVYAMSNGCPTRWQDKLHLWMNKEKYKI